jgi:hypothetical protein
MEEKFTLLQPASLPSASAAKPANPAMKQAVTYLAEFESVVNSHLRVCVFGGLQSCVVV